MDTFLATIIFISVVAVMLTAWLLSWLKKNYPQSYNDPAMAALGGFASFIAISSQKLPLKEPYNLLIVAIPIFLVISFMSAGDLSKKLAYSALSISALLISSGLVYFNAGENWVNEITVGIIFCILWVTLFRWRYVHNQNN